MSNWDPPQAGDTPEIPVTAAETATPFWKRKYRRLPVWGWALVGLVGLSASSAAFAPGDDDQLATLGESTSTTLAASQFADIESPTTESAATATPLTTTPVTVPPTDPAPTTTVAPATTEAPTTAAQPEPTTASTIAETTLPPTTTTTTPPTTTQATAVPAVEIAIRFDADGNDNQNKNDEWVRFGNIGSSALDMTSWVVEDEGPNHRYRFGAIVLQPGESVTLFSGCGADDSFNVYWCNSGSAVWNNSGDTVSLYDDTGALIAQRSG